MNDSGRGQTAMPPGATATNVWLEEAEELCLPELAAADDVPSMCHEAVVWIEEMEDLAPMPPPSSESPAAQPPSPTTITNVWIEAQEQT